MDDRLIEVNRKVEANNNCGNETSIYYSLLKIDSVKEPFQINANSGRICLDSILDYEQCTIYQLHVYAHHINGRSSRALVNVHVEDVNDNAPVFYPEKYNVSIRENVEIGSLLVLLLADDADSGIYGKVRYQFATEESDDIRLEAKSGRLYAQKKLSKENYDLMIEAVDEKGLISEKQAIVHINVINSSTQIPQFTSTLYKFNVLEETLPGITVGQVKVKGSLPVSYSIYSGDSDHFFSIDAESGEINVAQYLDADKWEKLLLNIQAKMEDSGTVNFTQVLIKLIDTNDNDPTFEMDKVESFIDENHPTHQPFFAVQAYDKDRGKNGKVIYSVLKMIQARDQGIPARSSNITVVLNVLDVNDNRPEFNEQIYSAEVSEDAQVMADILTIQANDLDSEQNARISYRLSEENRDFGIHPITGNIFVKSMLDREAIAEYQLIVIASDHGKPELSSQITVYIKILDINDNSPLCPMVNTFTVTDETDVGEIFDKMIASDPDEGINGSLLYRLQVEDVNFAIRDNGELFVKRKLSPKDYRKEGRLSIIILDRNGDIQARSTICPIRITIERIHSKVKLLEPIDRIIEIDDKCSSGCLLKILNATNVAKWEIEMSDISNNFEIWNNTLRTSVHFNAASIEDSRTLSIIAFDNDGRQKQITFIIRTSISRIPYLDDETIVIKIPKTIPIGSKLVTLSKEKRNGTFWHLENEIDAFYLDSITSTLYLATNFRWIHDKHYLLKVQKWNPPDYYQIEQKSVYIEVESTNIHWPQFTHCPRFFTIKENEPTGSIIGKISADEIDEGIDEQLSYSIIEGSKGLFSIDPDTAEILLIHSLHWEQDLSLFLVVEAENNYRGVARRSRCAVFIDIEDVNDHQPQFLSSHQIRIDDNFVDGDIIHHVVAIDNDNGDNAKITYTIIDGNIDDMFNIDSNTGALTLKHRFYGERSIRIRASDNGIPSKYTDKNIVVKFDSNRRQWKFFQKQKYFISMNSSTNPGTILYDFFVNKSEWPNMKLFSYFASTNDILQLSDDGKLISLRDTTPGKYTWLVTASRGKKFDWSSVHLSVIGVNQYPPRISPSSCGNLTIRENIAAKHLTRIYAWDEDEENNGGIFYKIVAGNENSAFFLNSSTGLLSCRELDREQQSQYFLVITAEDQGIPKRADTCTLRITVTDENDNVPVFDDDISRSIKIDDSKRVGDILIRLSATDHDEGPSGNIIYNIVEDTSSLLDIYPTTGEIIFARDYPISQGEYRVRVKVMDQGISRVLSSEFDIQLHFMRSKSTLISKEPQFLNEHYTGFINEGEERGQFVLQIRSSDHLTEDAPLAYSIVSGNIDAAFDIDNDGRIMTAQELDYEIENAYNLKVIGVNNVKNPPETNIHIRVINTNDNIPIFPILMPQKLFESATYGTLIATVTATDVDADTQLEYSLLSSNDLFEIDPFTGKIFLIQNLDYEINKEHTIHIQVTDGENISRTTLRIIVEDINDNAPQFEEQFYLINVAKDVKLGSKIAKIRANDPDTGLAGTVRYELAVNSTTNFKIDPESGDLIVVAKLEDRSTYYLKVHAFDQGKPSQRSIVVAQINIGIKDYDQKPIQFTEPSFNFTISENMRPYIEFGRVSLMDGLPMDTMLRIQTLEFANVFGISRDGWIFLKYFIDAEFKNEFEFSVEASSPHAEFNSSTKVYVQVMDLNDNIPYFIDQIDEITINEGMITNEVLGRFVAVDKDSGDNGRISYQVLSGNDYGMFTLNSSSGVLYFEKNVDIGEIPLNNIFDNLLIAAIDNGTPVRLNWTSISIRFNINSSSATAPFFIVSQYETNVFEDLPKGSIILRSKAVNKLGLPGVDWIYTLTDNNKSFSCNRNTGHIILIKDLDFEMETTHEFILKVRDNQNRSAAVSIRIHVLGVDEYPPIFTETNYIFQIPRNLQVGQYIGAVSAIDSDMGIDGIIRYEIEGSATRYLSIDSSTGQIMLSHKLSHSSTNITNDEFTVIASSSRTQSTHIKVIVQIGDFSSPRNVFTTSKTFTITQILTISSSLLFFILLVILIVLVISMKMRSRRTKPKKQVYSVNGSNFAVVRDLNRPSPRFEREKFVPHSSSSYVKSKNSSTSSAHINNNGAVRLLPKPALESQIGNHSVTYSMPDSGIDPDDISVTSSVTDYLNQVGVTPNKYFDSNQDSSREIFTGYKDDMRSDPEINDLIYAKVDEILSPANRMNACFTSNGSINISSFNANAINTSSVPAYRPLSELLLNMKK
ncbi:Protein dachsous [Dirofilaria immitis]